MIFMTTRRKKKAPDPEPICIAFRFSHYSPMPQFKLFRFYIRFCGQYFSLAANAVAATATYTQKSAKSPSSDGYPNVNLALDATNLPTGYGLGGSNLSLRPEYKAGYAVEVGSANALSVFGTLLQPDGTPPSPDNGGRDAGRRGTAAHRALHQLQGQVRRRRPRRRRLDHHRQYRRWAPHLFRVRGRRRYRAGERRPTSSNQQRKTRCAP